jgi:undecaprenyl-phosphate 4-deoxy-4-formamido-L-arabinose transferase
MHSISVVIPVYNSKDSLPLLIQRLEIVLLQTTADYEIILINDGSHDESWDVISKLVLEHDNVTGINLMRNYGQHNALLCGIRKAGFEIIVTIDDDLQNPPEEIPKLIDKLEEGFDVVYGVPHQEQHGIFRNLASQLTKLALQNVMGVESARNISSFRVFRSLVRDAFSNFQGPYISLDVLLTWGTSRFTSLPVKHEMRKEGKSNYTSLMLVSHAFNVITGFSTLPLQLSSVVGFLFTLFGVGIFVYVIGRFLILGYSVPGFPFLASIIAIFSGVQLFALGMIGEYLARVHFRTMDKPAYTIRESLNNGRE